MFKEVSTPNSEHYVYHPLRSQTLRFQVRAANDAHIILSQTVNPTNYGPVLEIVLGGWNNTASGIRRNFAQPDVDHIPTLNLLSMNAYRRFWINIQGSAVSVGRDDEVTPLMAYTDPMPFNFKYFGFRTGHGSTGDWIFNGESVPVATSDSLQYHYRSLPTYSLEFYVKAEHDADIALTAGPSFPMYEIFLGGWENTASAIRYNQTPGREEVKVPTPGIVSFYEPRYFRISSTNGLIQVHTQNNELMRVNEHPNFVASHFGVRTCHGAIGRWKIPAV